MNNKILIVGSFGIGALEHQYSRGLKNKGFEIFEYDIQKDVNSVREISFITKAFFKFNQNVFYNRANKELLNKVKSIKPKILFVFKGMEIFPETLAHIKQQGIFLINYNPDHPYLFFSEGAGNNNVKNSISIYDIYISYSTTIVNELNRLYKNSVCIPFGFDETIRVNNNPIDEIVFIGAYDKIREAELSSINSEKLFIYGPTNWGAKLNKNSVLLKKYKGKPLYNNDYYNVLSNSIASINFLRKQNIIEGSHNMRTFETAGVGGLLISNRTDEHLTFFEDGKEAFFFSDLDELNNIIYERLNDKKLITEIKNAASMRCRKSNYSYADRVNQLINII